MTLIMIEGIDRCGKTTAAELLKESGFEVIHFSAPSKHLSNADYFASIIREALATYNRNIVWDRTHWGEAVWPIVFHRNPKLTMSQLRLIDEILENLHSKDEVHRFYFHDPDIDALKARLRLFKEDLNESLLEFTMMVYQDFVVKQANWIPITFHEIKEKLCPLMK